MTDAIDRREIAIQLAYEAGKWAGQVEMEEYMEANNLFDAFQSSRYALRTGGGVAHHVSIDSTLSTRPIKYNLRSNEWRFGVKKSAAEYLKISKRLLEID